MTTTTKVKVFDHDPNAVLDYRWNWNCAEGCAWLEEGETIVSFTITTPSGITNVDSGPHPNSEADGIVTGWFTGGTVGARYWIINHIVTSAGREDDRTIELRVVQK